MTEKNFDSADGNASYLQNLYFSTIQDMKENKGGGPPKSQQNSNATTGNRSISSSSPFIKQEMSSSPSRQSFHSPSSGTYHSYDDNENSTQRRVSITALDKLQRQRREEALKRNLKLAESFITESLTGNATASASASATALPTASSSTFTSSKRPRFRPCDGPSPDNEYDDENDDILFPSRKKNGSFPQLKLRPISRQGLSFRNHGLLMDDHDDPFVIIPSRHQEVIDANNNVLRDLLPSPHSDKFVLLFPDNPTQEVDISEAEEDDDDEEVKSNCHCQQKQVKEGDRAGSETCNMDINQNQLSYRPEKNYYLLKQRDLAVHNNDLKATTSHTLKRHSANFFHYHGSSCPTHSASNSLSPLRTCSSGNDSSSTSQESPTTLRSEKDSSLFANTGKISASTAAKKSRKKKKKILLRPKPPKEGIVRQTNAQSLVMTKDCHSPNLGLVQQVLNLSLNDNGISDDTIAEYDNATGEGHGTTRKNNLDDPLQLRPNRRFLRRLSNSFFSKSSSAVNNDNNDNSDENVGQKKEEKSSSLSLPYLEAFTPRSPHITRARTNSTSTVQDQIEMAREAAARFSAAASWNHLSSKEEFLSPSQMSESNFRTPVSIQRRKWFHLSDYEECRHNDIHNHGNGSGVGLFLPALFGSSSEEDNDMSHLSHHSVTGSLIDMMKEALSPA
jgi:hypothetical protein